MMDLSESTEWKAAQEVRSPRDRILETAFGLLADRGLEGVNTNIVAQQAGVGVGTFYRYFEDKYALLKACMSQGLDLLQLKLANAQQNSAHEPLEVQLRAGVEAFVDFALEDPARFRVLFSLGQNPGHRSRVGLGFSPRGIETGIRALQKRGLVDVKVDPCVAARAFTAAQSQSVLWWLGESELVPKEDVIDTLVRLHPAMACRA